MSNKNAFASFLKIKLESTLTEISYDGWLYLYDVFLKFVSNEKKLLY